MLTGSAVESEKTTSNDAQPNGLRRRAVLILVILAAAILLGIFWRQIGDAVDFPRAKMVLAVRPFKNMSGDPNQDFVADGLTEEMITRLGQLHPDAMGVIRLSPMYASSGLDRIGKDVHANYVLEGGVRRSGQQVAITAQLIQVSDQTQVWGESYERDLQDVLRLQSEVAGAIAGGVLNKLPHAQPPARQVNGEAYLAYLEGRYFWSKRTEEGFAKALTMFRRSIEIDPTYAPPYAGLADCYELLGSAPYSTLAPREAFPKAESAARKALELDGTLAEAHVSLGYSQLVYEWNFPEAKREFETALHLRPEYATGHQFYGYYLTVRLPVFVHHRRASLDFPMRPQTSSVWGERGISRFPCEVLRYVHGVCDRAGSRGTSRYRRLGWGLPLLLTASASRSEFLTRLNTRPVLSPVNASSPPSRAAPHDSGPLWFASPSTYETFIHNTSPVLTGAQGVTKMTTKAAARNSQLGGQSSVPHVGAEDQVHNHAIQPKYGSVEGL